MINSKEQNVFWENSELDTRRNYDHPAIKIFAENKISSINKVIDFKEKRVLELGAGNGFFSYYLSLICDLLATDYSEKMIELNPVYNKRTMDAKNIDFSDGKFDVVFESCMLHHIRDDLQVVNEMSRVAKKYVILIEPNRNNPLMFAFCLLKKVERGGLKYSLKHLKQIAIKSDLKIINAYSHGIILPNKTPWFLTRFLNIFDRKIYLFGFYNIVVCQKKDD